MDLFHTLLEGLTYLAPAIALLAFLVALASAIAMVRRRAPGVSLWHLVTHGMDFWSGKGFQPHAAPFRRRFLIAAAVFFLAVIAAAVSFAILAGDQVRG